MAAQTSHLPAPLSPKPDSSQRSSVLQGRLQTDSMALLYQIPFLRTKPYLRFLILADRPEIYDRIRC